MFEVAECAEQRQKMVEKGEIEKKILSAKSY
jgi:hypothetical protein